MSKLSANESVALWEECGNETDRAPRTQEIFRFGWAVEKTVREKVVEELEQELERRLELAETYAGSPLYAFERYAAEAVREAIEKVKAGTK